jgi:hypothetical protein
MHLMMVAWRPKYISRNDSANGETESTWFQNITETFARWWAETQLGTSTCLQVPETLEQLSQRPNYFTELWAVSGIQQQNFLEHRTVLPWGGRFWFFRVYWFRSEWICNMFRLVTRTVSYSNWTTWPLCTVPTSQSQSQSQSYFTTGGLPPISSSWRQAPWDSRPDFFRQQ